MQNKDIQSMLQQMVKELFKQSVLVLTQAGVDYDSDLIKSIDFVVAQNRVEVVAFDYYHNVNAGRKPRTRKVPIRDLIEWIRQVGIRPNAGMSLTGLAYAIQTNIYKTGISGKFFDYRMVDTVSETVATNLSDEISIKIAEDIVRELKY